MSTTTPRMPSPTSRLLNAGGTLVYEWFQYLRDVALYGAFQTLSCIGSVVIGGTSAASNLILDVRSTTQAFAPPRMTTAQMLAIPSPTEGMVVYDTTVSRLSYYDGGAWQRC